MRILHTAESYPPAICGVQGVVQEISEGLAARGHEITVATTYFPLRKIKELNGVRIEQFDIRGKWVRKFRGEVKKYQQFISSFRCDIMMNYAAQQWSTDLVFPLLDKLPYVKVLVPCGYSSLHNWKWWPYFHMLPSVLSKYNHIVYHSENYQDKQFGDHHGVSHYSVIGNGAADEEFGRSRSGFLAKHNIDTSRMFLCVSNYGAGKNQEMVLKAYQEANVSDSTLVFIGSEFNEYSDRLMLISKGCDDNVVFLERLAREEVVTAYHEADIFIFGSQLECFPLVILEAMASRTPFISTDVGCVNQLSGGMIVESTSEMTDTIRYLADKGTAWQQLAEDGRRAWEDKYRWDKIITDYEALYQELYEKQLCGQITMDGQS